MSIRPGVPFAEYRAIHAVSSGYLRTVYQHSPAHAEHAALQDRDTPAMRVGRALHCMALENSEYAERFVTLPAGIDRRKTPDRKLVAELEAAYPRGVLTPEEDGQVTGMFRALRDNEQAWSLLNRMGDSEVTVTWEDRVPCKARLDHFSKVDTLLDLKTCQSAARRDFERECRSKWYYGLQLAFYRMGLRACGREPLDVYLIALESSRPHGVVIYPVAQTYLNLWESTARILLAQIAEYWLKPGLPVPGLPEVEEPILPAAWEIGQLEPAEDDGAHKGLGT